MAKWRVMSTPIKPSYQTNGMRRVVWLDGKGALVFAFKVKPGAYIQVKAEYSV